MPYQIHYPRIECEDVKQAVNLKEKTLASIFGVWLTKALNKVIDSSTVCASWSQYAAMFSPYKT